MTVRDEAVIFRDINYRTFSYEGGKRCDNCSNVIRFLNRFRCGRPEAEYVPVNRNGLCDEYKKDENR